MDNETKSLAGAVGRPLSVYASKTTAEALALGSTEPNAMCFPTDGDEIVFAGKKFGGSAALSDYQTTDEADAKYVQKVAGKGLSTNDYTTAEKNKLAGIETGAQKNTVTSVAGKTGAVTLAKADVGLGNVDNTSDVNKPISTAVQTALNLKAAKADVYTKSEVDAKVSTVYKVKGTKATIAEVIALTNAVVGDVWNVTAEFTLSSKKYPAGTNVVCVTATSSSSHADANWDALGGTVDLTPYAKVENLPGFVPDGESFSLKCDVDEIELSFVTKNTQKNQQQEGFVYFPGATESAAGIMLPSDKVKLDKAATVHEFKNAAILDNTSTSDKIKEALGLTSSYTFDDLIADSEAGVVYYDSAYGMSPLTGVIGDYIQLLYLIGDVFEIVVISRTSGTGASSVLTCSSGSIESSKLLTKNSVINNLTSTSTNMPLSAAQGKVLNDKITALQNTVNTLVAALTVK
ncbi:hypothetical protein DWW69_09605 [Bacteroides sp. AF16-49]|uniref:hypothetical protein n=1 Tax=Bacteroides sp. AF16-49 TaxID=2292192 RepID=UPI000EFE7B7B|nr:hypothetical protein [Bacteroides sp. AF16-49]RHR75535.1 hypothetical protein DWW69_09605 [Bacteroides sp. AF16-49]